MHLAPGTGRAKTAPAMLSCPLSSILGRMPDFVTKLRSNAAELPPAFWFLWLGTIINRLGGFVVPFLSLYLTTQRGISISEAGLILSLFGAGSFASQLLGGELADRLGRRPVLLMSLLITPAFTVSLGLARSLPLIGLCTLALGVFTDLYRPAVNAAIADLVPATRRVRAFGYMYWAINLGAALAPIMAGFLARANFLLLFLGDAATTFVYGLIVLRRVPESQPTAAVPAVGVGVGARLQQLRREPILLAFTALTFFGALIYMQGIVILPLDMVRHGLSTADYGLAIASNAILIVLITMQTSQIVGRWPPFSAISLAALLFGLGFGVNAFAATLPLYVFGVIIWSLGEVISAAVAPAIIASLSPVEFRGLYQGIFGSAWGLALLVGPVLGGWIFDRLSPAGLWFGCSLLGLLVALGYLAISRPAHRRLAAA